MFKLSIETDNAAFGEMPEIEVIRILKETIILLEQGFDEQTLHDVNGNNVGKYTLNKR